jgi:serine-type D-Ala-D-Ala carboxypeptidase (penicillin-binding protein 5/6)
MRRRGLVGAAGALAAAALLAAAPAAPAVASTSSTAFTATKAVGRQRAGLPPPPPCATAVSLSDGKATTKAAPLPAPASEAGGERLARPGLQVELQPGVPRPPALRTTAWVVADLDSGAVVASCNAHVPLAPASTMKILTALALHPRIDGNARYVARPEDAAIDGTKVGLSPGSLYSVADLWHGLLLGSGNDTASALAALAGGLPAATGLMTATARALGAQDTVVANTSGLDAPGQVSSAYDLALFGRALLRDPALARLVSTRTYAFPSKGTATQRSRRTYQIQNHNLLLGRYAGATGVKNGYTTAAGASLVASARRGGHSYLVAMLRGQPQVFPMASALLDWAFASAGRAAAVGTLDVPPAPPPGSTASGAPAPVAAGDRLPGTAVQQAVTAPVRATLGTVPASSRTSWLLAGLAVALIGAAFVRRGVPRRAAPARRPARPPVRRGRPAAGRHPRTATKRPSR